MAPGGMRPPSVPRGRSALAAAVARLASAPAPAPEPSPGTTCSHSNSGETFLSPIHHYFWRKELPRPPRAAVLALSALAPPYRLRCCCGENRDCPHTTSCSSTALFMARTMAFSSEKTSPAPLPSDRMGSSCSDASVSVEEGAGDAILVGGHHPRHECLEHRLKTWLSSNELELHPWRGLSPSGAEWIYGGQHNFAKILLMWLEMELDL